MLRINLKHFLFADVTGVEPAPNCVTGRHLNRLTSHPYFVEKVGIEPTN